MKLLESKLSWLATLLLFCRCAFATDWSPRKDVGVAAVDRASGKTVWEAWHADDIPKEASDTARAAAIQLISKWEFDYDRDIGRVSFPFQLADDWVVSHASDGKQCKLSLSRGTLDRVGQEVATFSHAAGGQNYNYLLGGQVFYAVIDGFVRGFVPPVGDPPADKVWRDLWSYDLLETPEGKPRNLPAFLPIALRADENGLWIADDKRIRRLTPMGKVQSEYVLKNPWPAMWDGFGTPLTIGRRHIYYRHATGVIALERRTKKEAWRLLTTRFPYPSLVEEVDGGLTLIQIGSAAPRTLRGALEGDTHPLPKFGANTPARNVAAATLLKTYGDGYLRDQLRAWTNEARKGDAAHKAAAAKIDGLLEDWPQKRDRQRMIGAAVNMLLSEETKERALVWCLLQELAYSSMPDGDGGPGSRYSYDTWREYPLPMSAERKRALTAHCRHVLSKGDENEKGYAASLLVSQAVGWSELGDDELPALFLSDHPSVWRWAGMAMTKNGRRDDVVKLVKERGADDHMDAIWMLAHDRAAKPSELEEQFWLDCVKRMPPEMAFVLEVYSSRIRPEYRQPVREYLEKEIAKPTVLEGYSQPQYGLVSALRILNRWKNPDDTGLLTAYLKHPCSVQLNNGTRYIVREHVAAMLKQREIDFADAE